MLPPRPETESIHTRRKQRSRPKRRELFCPAHPDQLIQGNGRKYFLHLLQPEQLQQRGISAKKAQLIINAYPVLVLSNEWLEELFCPQCGTTVGATIKHDAVLHGALGAAGIMKQVAHDHSGQSDGERVHPPQRPSQCDETGGRQALFRLIRTNNQGEDRIKCRAS